MLDVSEFITFSEEGGGQTKYLSSEVCGGFTGAMLGLYATGDNKAEFTDFEVIYE